MRRRKQQSTEGAYSITGHGVDTSSINLGAAISKALTYAGRAHKAGLNDGEEVRSIYIRKLGEEAVARVDVRRDAISVVSL